MKRLPLDNHSFLSPSPYTLHRCASTSHMVPSLCCSEHGTGHLRLPYRAWARFSDRHIEAAKHIVEGSLKISTWSPLADDESTRQVVRARWKRLCTGTRYHHSSRRYRTFQNDFFRPSHIDDWSTGSESNTSTQNCFSANVYALHNDASRANESAVSNNDG